MSIQDDLARNRAVFAARTGGRTQANPVEAAPILPKRVESARVPAPILPPPPLTRAEEPAREDEPRRIIHTLGVIPDRSDRPAIETGVAYPDVKKEAAPPGENTLTDGAYRSLLRRFEQDARRESQPGREEEFL
jgi:hypothetical protein